MINTRNRLINTRNSANLTTVLVGNTPINTAEF
jgi:hypothetical protein